MEHVIEVSHLRKSFGSHEVLRDVDFVAGKGEVTCIIGSSGSGKSTLLRCINLLETPDSGVIRFHGEDILPGNWLFKKLILKPDTKAGILSYEANR